MEVKVAQNFVLNFLYNKLPRRRVNLFGEELETALLDKFQDHWYPDKPFKGSAFRCLRITDPNDPVLNRAARESGNPLSDIIENLPADLAIWIDPGEVSYRIGEKGSVKILYSKNDPIVLVGDGPPCNNGSNGSGYGGISPGLQTSSSTSSGASDDLNAEIAGFLPLDNLNVAMSALSCNHNSSVGPPVPPSINSQQSQGGPPVLNQGVHSTSSNSNSMNLNNGGAGGNGPNSNASGTGSAGGGNGGGNSHALHNNGPPPGLSNGPSGLSGNPVGSNTGFTPFQPRPHHQPVTYTAGTFAQTKFGSTKLKTNGKKTNRMSPTEFSNYIKQRALQKQNSVGSQYNSTPMRINGAVGNNAGFRPLTNSSSNGFFNHPSQQPSHHSQVSPPTHPHSANNMNFGNSRNNINSNPDSYFFPLFPDRSGSGGNSSGSGSSNGSINNTIGSTPSAFHQQNSFGGSSANSSGLTQNRSNNPWSSGMDSDTEAILQDILSVGLSSKPSPFSRGSSGFFSELNGSSDFGSSLAGNLLSDRFPNFNDDSNKGMLGDTLNSGRGGNNSNNSSGNEKYHQRVLVAN
ncbi:hypothetical protein TCAL_01411 [Tigriopus californicus]|uniref:Anti-proliferative protein domain-containing protein n=1 Tax=Tigriopus californicus TaxID=6832 RepID=A0A553NSW8_TIGCA|nr:protein Tob1-like [Tigriopus californicus]TRY68534.1 hypothetical protein TCAL_01411 [Tigriopus californicus]|eukprot:TCALIF_01411-PA protein Name:"Similar to TOB1 Protein Tob1 (Homo sapiens)" AED:0.36 eAED:0.83 QI:0/-1/0/1/-1/1/1/0/572